MEEESFAEEEPEIRGTQENAQEKGGSFYGMKIPKLSEYRMPSKFGILLLNLQEESPKNNPRERISSFGK